jgi:gliding motility-associated-like protein
MLEANNRYGCASRVANAVHVRLSEQPPNPPAPQQALTIPNVFTPNGDGVNEGFGNFFGPAGLATPSQYRLRIYDRWGNQVYSTDAAPQRWQGRHEGQPASEGTYFYQLSYEQADGERVERSGEVTLLR